jgi:hypothetical protein
MSEELEADVAIVGAGLVTPRSLVRSDLALSTAG